MTRKPLLALIPLVLITALTMPANADDDGEEPAKKSYWSVSFLGGLLNPLSSMGDSHKRALAAGGRFGWTSKMGLGIDFAADYSPLPRKNVQDLWSYQTHFVLATVGPKMTLGSKKLRVWVAAGGGVAFERTEAKYPQREPEHQHRIRPGCSRIRGGGASLHLERRFDRGGQLRSDVRRPRVPVRERHGRVGLHFLKARGAAGCLPGARSNLK